MKLHWSQDLKGDIKDFSFGGWGWMQMPPLSTKYCVYNSEIWPENQLAYTKSLHRFQNYIQAVIIGVIYEPVIGVAGGGLRCSQNLPNKAHVSQ